MAVQFLPHVAVGVGTAAVAWRTHALRGRQGLYEAAGVALEAAGFQVRPVTEHHVEQHRGGVAHDVELKSALVARRGERLELALDVRTSEEARGMVRCTGLSVVKSATFEIAREGLLDRAARTLGVSDIEIGEPAFDAALKVGGWPADQVRALVAQPAVRAQLELLFGVPGVRELRLSARGGETAGTLRLSWRMPLRALESLGGVADALERLAQALEEARWVEPQGRPGAPRPSAGPAGPASGTPMAIPGTGPRR